MSYYCPGGETTRLCRSCGVTNRPHILSLLLLFFLLSAIYLSYYYIITASLILSVGNPPSTPPELLRRIPSPLSVPGHLPSSSCCDVVTAAGRGRGIAPLSQFHSSACPAFCPPKPSGLGWPASPLIIAQLISARHDLWVVTLPATPLALLSFSSLHSKPAAGASLSACAHNLLCSSLWASGGSIILLEFPSVQRSPCLYWPTTRLSTQLIRLK